MTEQLDEGLRSLNEAMDSAEGNLQADKDTRGDQPKAEALVALQITYYEAKTTTFGCTSIDAVSELQKVRSDDRAFQAALMDKQLYGECVAILKGTQVDGSIDAADNSILRVNEKIEPPGYEAPLEDFETKAMDGKQGG